MTAYGVAVASVVIVMVVIPVVLVVVGFLCRKRIKKMISKKNPPAQTEQTQRYTLLVYLQMTGAMII